MRSGVQDQPGQHGEILSLLNIQKISQAWWPAPVISASQEAEAGESLEPGGGGCGELRLYHGTPAWATERDSVSKKERKKKTRHQVSVFRIEFYLGLFCSISWAECGAAWGQKAVPHYHLLLPILIHVLWSLTLKQFGRDL